MASGRSTGADWPHAPAPMDASVQLDPPPQTSLPQAGTSNANGKLDQRTALNHTLAFRDHRKRGVSCGMRESPDRDIARIAGRQRTTMTVAQLRACGASSGRVELLLQFPRVP